MPVVSSPSGSHRYSKNGEGDLAILPYLTILLPPHSLIGYAYPSVKGNAQSKVYDVNKSQRGSHNSLTSLLPWYSPKFYSADPDMLFSGCVISALEASHI